MRAGCTVLYPAVFLLYLLYIHQVHQCFCCTCCTYITVHPTRLGRALVYAVPAVLVGAQPDWALGLTLIRQVLIRQVENIGPPDLDLHSYS